MNCIVSSFYIEMWHDVSNKDSFIKYKRSQECRTCEKVIAFFHFMIWIPTSPSMASSLMQPLATDDSVTFTIVRKLQCVPSGAVSQIKNVRCSCDPWAYCKHNALRCVHPAKTCSHKLPKPKCKKNCHLAELSLISWTSILNHFYVTLSPANAKSH